MVGHVIRSATDVVGVRKPLPYRDGSGAVVTVGAADWIWLAEGRARCCLWLAEKSLRPQRLVVDKVDCDWAELANGAARCMQAWLVDGQAQPYGRESSTESYWPADQCMGFGLSLEGFWPILLLGRSLLIPKGLCVGNRRCRRAAMTRGRWQ